MSTSNVERSCSGSGNSGLEAVEDGKKRRKTMTI